MNGESHSSATSPLMDGSDGIPPIKNGDLMKNGRFAMVEATKRWGVSQTHWVND